jgi:two-component system chemotaxis response regulator CheB
MNVVREELIFKVKTAASAKVTKITPLSVESPSDHTQVSDKVVSIAASTGGPQALTQVLKALPADAPPLLIVQHMPKVITKHFAEGLNDACKFSVKEAQEGDRVQEALALIAPGGFHMTITKDKRIHLTIGPLVNFVRPSADVLMISAAQVFGSKNVGVVLTGMGSDGANGIRAIKENGGFTIAQDEKTCVVFGMPKVAFETGCVDAVAPLDGIPKRILKACN